MKPRLLSSAALLLCALALIILTVAGLSETHTIVKPSLLAVLALTLAKLVWLAHMPRLARGLAAVTLGCLALGLASYLLPEYWIGTEAWHALASWLASGSSLDDWRPPLFATLCLILLGGTQLCGRQAALGSPMLLGLALLMWLAQLDLGVSATTRWVLDYAASPAALAAMGCLLMAHGLSLFGLPAEERRLLSRPLWQSMSLGILALTFSQHQQTIEDRRLHRLLDAENQRLTEQLSREVGDQLAATRRFANSWRLLEAPPDAATWALMAEPLYHDYRYFENIALVTPDTRIRHVHPMSEVNRRIIGTRLYESQPAGRPAQRQALDDHQESTTGVLKLLQGQYGIIYYLPTQVASGDFIGASAMVLSLQTLTDTLQDTLDAQRTRVELRQTSAPLATLGAAEGVRDWAHRSQIEIGNHPLMLTTLPTQQRLQASHARLPAVSLTTGLGLAYLLFLVLYAHRHLGIQHQLLHRSHTQLHQEIEARTRLQKEVEWLARHDELTSLPNRRMLMDDLKSRYDVRPLCVMICDLDHFKRINDNLGHLAGDECLQRLGELGHAVATRAGGMFARYGGEEFVVLLPGYDSVSGRQVADELMTALKDAKLMHHDGTPLTMSIGLTVLERGELNIASLMQVADDALYRAKELGRNRVVSAPLPG
ncbi:GGDEF domain-containing protein [Halomonas salinarum]|uniref:GGDEF domain-containing protein n=1 Tax=Halomonas salinarum TaxID=1158993 RepID=UPI00143CA637|nr:sensor domain-containing diguanylate cyclase [Halomonas salinarum]